MSELVGARPPGWFRLLAIVAILWDLIGVATHLQKVGMFGDPLAGIAMPALITAIAILLVWLAHIGTRRGWLKQSPQQEGGGE
jgi:hypothetical protein